ncbi:DNA polymerase [Acinetobacter phage Presley]|uniref:DNA polymerase n=1 Tax=Acinetobacter phage Presley TaxID=1406780 RepID=U5PW18_9CAUD|nr:DNA polymerase [Acinetobacter phage Presley]AGY48104.1 DNA polymerase [Acinetobacter phage Presley]
MKTLTFGKNPNRKYPIAILIKTASLEEDGIRQYYVDPMVEAGINPEDIIAIELQYNSSNKAPAKLIKDYLELIAPALAKMEVEHIYCADSAYFKALTKEKKADPHIGNIVPCRFNKDLEHINVAYGLNHSSLIYNPAQKDKIEASITALINVVGGNFKETCIEFTDERYPIDFQDIKEELAYLHQFDELAVDIETFGLKLNKAGLGTISFAESITSGCAFFIDYYPIDPQEGLFATRRINAPVRRILKKFFEDYQGKLVAHNASFDFRILIYELFMEHPLDKKGMIHGIHTLCRCFDDTKIIAYCALNSTAETSYGLKSLGQGYAGNYAEEDIKDIRKIEPFNLLRYNLSDTCTTLWVKEKYYPIMVRDDQLDVYEQIMLPMQKVLLQCELHGMPMFDERIQEVKQTLTDYADGYLDTIYGSHYVAEVTHLIQVAEMNAANAKLKTKQHPLSHFKDKEFNPNSPKQLCRLLYEVMELPELGYTPTGQPTVDGDTLENLCNHTNDQDKLDLLKALVGFFKVDKIMSTFIPAFESGILKADGMRYLHGSFNIGGTRSGRLSSSDPNLQQIPSNSAYGDLIKLIFGAPDGYIMVGADFNSLEDYISALLSKDTNKLKVYLDGYDGHCLRAFYYFREKMPDINESVESINSIKKKYPDLRQDSKAPTFALTYGGTNHALQKQCGFDKETAIDIEEKYHELYRESDEYVQRRLNEVSRKGYAELAFGFRIRAPLLKATVHGSRQQIRAAAGEGRTVGNALGQSYGLLNNRSMIAFMRKVWKSPYIYDIMPIAPIHDASYYIIKDDPDVLKFVNDHLIEEMEWQELPEIWHDKVRIGAELDVFYPDWKHAITLKNRWTREQILDHIDQTMAKREEEENE